jgi:hypothetical protein
MRWILIVIGALLLLLGGFVWFDKDEPGMSTVMQDSTTTVLPPKESGEKVTKVNSSDTTEPGDPTTQSEAVAVALIGAGALIGLCGMFYARIQEISFPGVGGLKLSTQAQATLAEKAAERADKDPRLQLTPETVRDIYEAALQRLQVGSAPPATTRSDWSEGWGETSPPDDVLYDAVDKAAESVVRPEASYAAPADERAEDPRH